MGFKVGKKIYYRRKGVTHTVMDHDYHYKSIVKKEEKYNKKPSKKFWTGKNFNKGRY